MNIQITGKQFDEERALYNLTRGEVTDCVFAGPADGESALKECRDVTVTDCDFHLRYPFWHAKNTVLDNCRMTDTCRAALWYDADVTVRNSKLGGIKALRECDNSVLEDSLIESTEFGWYCRGVHIKNCELKSEYPFLHTSGMVIAISYLDQQSLSNVQTRRRSQVR